jgi:hypothetical protein
MKKTTIIVSIIAVGIIAGSIYAYRYHVKGMRKAELGNLFIKQDMLLREISEARSRSMEFRSAYIHEHNPKDLIEANKYSRQNDSLFSEMHKLDIEIANF